MGCSYIDPTVTEEMTGYQLQQASNDSSSCHEVELMISCTDLANLEIFSKSDPMCVIFVRQFGQWVEIGRTESIRDSLHPKFTETFILDYKAYTDQQLKFSIYDIDNSSADLKKHDFVGSFETTLVDLLPADSDPNITCQRLYAHGDPTARGWITICSEFIKECKSKVYLQTGTSKVKKKGLFTFNKIGYYLEVSRSISSCHFHPVYHSPVVSKGRHGPRWRPFELSGRKLCNGNLDRLLQFSIWQVENNKKQLLIGEAQTSIRELQDYKGKQRQTFTLNDPKKTAKKGYKGAGFLKMLQFTMDTQYSLLDYIRGGLHLQLAVAIDFTSSNGPPDDPLSLHHLGKPQKNPYVQALKSVGTVLAHYALDQRIPAFGFGALQKTAKHSNQDKNFFPLNGDYKNPCVKGMPGVLAAYRHILPKLQLSGPSRLSSVIKDAIQRTQKELPDQQKQVYNILLIVTDGVVNDLDDVIDLITEASSLPLTIMLVGVGPADFSIEEDLCRGQSKSSQSGRKATRENVCFVGFKKQKYITGTNNILVRDTMAKISTQVTEYMKSMEIKPNPPILQKTSYRPAQWIADESYTNQEEPSIDLSEITLSPTYFLSNRKIKTCTDTIELTCPACGSSIDNLSTR